MCQTALANGGETLRGEEQEEDVNTGTKKPKSSHGGVKSLRQKIKTRPRRHAADTRGCISNEAAENQRGRGGGAERRKRKREMTKSRWMKRKRKRRKKGRTEKPDE